MKVKELKEWLNKLDDGLEVFIRNSYNVCGNISELMQIEKTSYGFFGTSIDCISLNSEVSANEYKLKETGNFLQYIETSGYKSDENRVVAYRATIDGEVQNENL